MYNRDEIQLRECRGEDASILLEWENNKDNWRVSDRSEVLSLKDLESLIETQQNAENSYDLDQYRYLICESKTGRPIGTIDFYETDWEKDTAYVGILIAKREDRGKGAGAIALELILGRMSQELELEKAFARILPDNEASVRLFEKAGFKKNLEENQRGEQDADYIEFVCELEKK